MAESEFSHDLRKWIWKLRIFNYKTSDRFQSGVPDIYIAGGNWIESKKAPIPVTRPTYVMRFIEPAQRNMLNELQAGGDECFIAIRWVDERKPRHYTVTITRWEHFKHIHAWSLSSIRMLSAPATRKDGWPYLDKIFNRGVPRNVDLGWLDETFEEWKAKYPDWWTPHDLSGSGRINPEDKSFLSKAGLLEGPPETCFEPPCQTPQECKQSGVCAIRYMQI